MGTLHNHRGWLIAWLLVPSATALAIDSEVVKVARTYPDGGGYNAAWTGSGTPAEIRFKGERILDKGDRTYCCGFTFSVAVEVARKRGLLAQKSVDEIRMFQKHWYGVPEESRETLCVYAMETLGVGTRVRHDEARAGDMLQFWRRDGSGHSAVFLAWVFEGSRRIGLKYRGSQQATAGIGDRIEYFSDAPGDRGRVVRSRTHLGRLHQAAPPYSR